VSVKDNLECTPFAPPPSMANIGLLYADVAFVSDKAFQREMPANELIDRLLTLFEGQASAALTAARCMLGHEGSGCVHHHGWSYT